MDIWNLWEVFAFNIHKSSSFCRSRVSWDRSEQRFDVIAVGKTCIWPVNSIQTGFKRDWNIDVFISRSCAYYSDSAVKLSSYNFVSKLAVRDYSIFWIVSKVKTNDRNLSSASRKSSLWVHLKHLHLLVVVEFDITRIILIVEPVIRFGCVAF